MKITLLLLIILSSALFAFGQTGMSYQAVARNDKGDVLPDYAIAVQFSIVDGNPNGTILYTERHQVQTSNLGLFTVTVGGGQRLMGNYGAIKWGQGPKFLKVDLDPNGGNNYLPMGTTQFLAVPYSYISDTTLHGDRWGGQTTRTDGTLNGDGTTAAPLGIGQQAATKGQTLKWNGTTWAPGNDDVSGGAALTTSARISGNGTPGSPLDIAGMGAQSGQILKWTGTAWAPANPQTLDFQTAPPLRLNQQGTLVILSLTNGSADGDQLVWNAARLAWEVRKPDAQLLTAGNGINILNNQIINTAWTVGGPNAYRLTGSVGVGTDKPNARLEIKTNSNIDLPHLNLMEDDKDFARLSFRNVNNNNYWSLIGRPEAQDQVGRMIFYYSYDDQEIMTLTDSGKVGVGTTNPEAGTKFEVYAAEKYAGLFSTDYADKSATVVNAYYDRKGDYDAVAVSGDAEAAPGKGFGGQFFGGNTGVFGAGYGEGFDGQYAVIGVYGEAYDDGSRRGTRMGVQGFGQGGEFNMGVYGSHNGKGRQNYAGYFEGNVYVEGVLQKSMGSFKIDHPLAPAEKYLLHSFVESPDMLNIYSGTIVTDADGLATVTLPAYFDTLNIDVRYYLTPIGQLARACVQETVRDNRFVIRTDMPNVKVCWQVQGVRNDPYARVHRLQTEELKTGSERGRYLHPVEYGQPKELGMSELFKRSPVEKPVHPTRRPQKGPSLNRANGTVLK